MHDQVEQFQCEAPTASHSDEAQPRGAWLNALLRLFAELACRLR